MAPSKSFGNDVFIKVDLTSALKERFRKACGEDVSMAQALRLFVEGFCEAREEEVREDK